MAELYRVSLSDGERLLLQQTLKDLHIAHEGPLGTPRNFRILPTIVTR